MNIRLTYWITFLSLILSVSLVYPFCCHAGASEQHTHHQQEITAQTFHAHQHNVSDCSCGHQFRKEITKVDNTVAKSLQKVSSSVVSTNNLLPRQTKKFTKVYNPTFFLRSNPDPPIHLLNSVFLN